MSDNLLDAAIREYKIPPCPYEAVYDRIVVFSVPEDKASRDTFTAGGLITKPDSTKDKEEAESPRGILVSAGLGARDVLVGHGIGLGHMLWVARLAPWRHVVDRTEKGPVEFLFMRVGDIVGSETLLGYIKDGSVKIDVGTNEEHQYRYLNGDLAPRFDPPSYVG